MKSSWPLASISEVCETAAGGTPLRSRKEYYENGTIPWLMSGEVAQGDIWSTTKFITPKGLENSAAKVFPEDTVLVAMYGATAGQVGLLRFAAATNQAVCGILPNGKFLPRFLYYFFLHCKDALVAQAIGNAQPNISQVKIRNMKVPLVPFAEQRRIVGILDKAFAAIAIATANTEKNLQNARAIFESKIQKVFANHWATGPLGKLADLASDITDGDHLPPPKARDGVPFITIGNINKETRKIDFSDTFMVPRSYFEGLKTNRKPRKGDVLYTVTGSFGIPVTVDNGTEFCFQRHIGLVRPKPEVLSKWLYYLLLSPQVSKQADDGATGAAQRTVSLHLLRNFQVPMVNRSQQELDLTSLDSIAREVERLEINCRSRLSALDELKRSLLREAFAGEL